ncbi:MAG: hypothetical protein ACLQVK_04460 [Acidimicrobiales bacterium]
MRFNKKGLAAVIALTGLAIAGGAAFTAGNDPTALQNNGYEVAGYGKLTVTGATLVSLNYTLDGNDPTSVTAVTFVTAGDTSEAQGYVGFNGTGTVGAACTGHYDSDTTYTTYLSCALPTPGTELVQDISSTDLTVAPSQSVPS